MDTMGKRIRAARVALGISQDAVASPFGIKRNSVSLWESDQTRPDQGKLGGLAEILKVDVSWLLDGEGRGPRLAKALQWQSAEPRKRPPSFRPEVTPGETKLIPIRIVGTVEAGAFREVDGEDQSEPEFIYGEPDAEFPQARIMAMKVEGDSMNALKPQAIAPGARIICVDYEDLGDFPLRNGMVVVVQQTMAGGHLREWSVKQLEIKDDRYEFHPRSTNPRHKAIVVKGDLWADDGREVSILALVRQVSNSIRW